MAKLDGLLTRFNRSFVDGLTFRDVSDIPLGAQFDAVLRRELVAAKTVLVLIGPTWLTELQQRLTLAKCQAMTLRDESWSQDVDRLIDAIGRQYPWKKVALRAVVALILIVVAVNRLLPFFPDDLANDIGFLRILVATLTGVYALFEFGLVYRYFRKLRRRYEH